MSLPEISQLIDDVSNKQKSPEQSQQNKLQLLFQVICVCVHVPLRRCSLEGRCARSLWVWESL